MNSFSTPSLRHPACIQQRQARPLKLHCAQHAARHGAPATQLGARPRRQLAARASGDDKPAQQAQQQPEPTGVAKLVGTPVYTAIEIGELLVLLMLYDAAWSGDWSRIGAITKETELVLQKISLVPLFGHLGTAAAAGVLASQKGKSPWLPAAKGYLFGALGLYEEQHSRS